MRPAGSVLSMKGGASAAREAPAISQTFDTLTSSTSLPTVRCSFFDQSCDLLRPGDVDRMTGARDFDLVAVGSFGIPPFQVRMDGSV